MKFYVSSGVHKEIITAPDVTEASITFLERVRDQNDQPKLGMVIQVSEVGFSASGPGHENDHWLAVKYVQKQLDNK